MIIYAQVHNEKFLTPTWCPGLVAIWDIIGDGFDRSADLCLNHWKAFSLNVTLDFVAESSKSLKFKMPVAETKAKGFPGAGMKPGLEIWRIESFKPVKLDPKEHGKFYTGDSYIVLYTKKVGGEADIFFWLGPETTQDESGAAAQLACMLDDELGGFPVQHRVVGGHEDNKFSKLFKSMSLLKGGHASGFKEGKKKFEKALLQVKGKRKVYASQVPLSVASLNQGDCFVFDCGRKIFVWIGKESNKKERLNACRYAQELRDEERAGLASVSLIDTPEEEEEFFYHLTGNKRIVQITKEGESDKDHEQVLKLNLYRVKEEESGNITMKETGSKPLGRHDLDSDDVFILETGFCIYVWLGKKATRGEKAQALRDAQGFISARQLNPNTTVKVVKEEVEPTEFKQYFNPWEKAVSYGNTKVYQAGVGIATKEKLDQRPKFEVKSMHERRVSVTNNSLPDDGSGTVKVWRIEDFERRDVPEDNHGVFYSGDCYVILYTYLKNSKEYRIIYFWLGNDSTADEQGAAAAHAVEIDDEFGGDPYQVRVCEGKEPLHFFMIFKHRLLIYQGGHASGFKNVKDQAFSSDTRLFQVRVTGNNARVVEVAPLAQSLNSTDVFLLNNPQARFLWLGKKSIGDEKDCARSVEQKISNGPDFELIVESKEPDLFWQLLGGRADYDGTSVKTTVSEENGDNSNNPARLFHCSDASGRFMVNEIIDFGQEDLEEDDVMILDAWSQLFVWVGKEARKEEKKEAIRTAVEYIKTDPRERIPDMTMSVIKQGAEPAKFKSFFVAWEPQMWNKKMTYEDQIRAIKEGNDKVDESKWTLTEWNEKLKPKNFPLEILRKKGEELPEEVDPTKKELHLEDAQFEELFRMSKEAWEKVPLWKKNQRKKELDLF